METPAVHRIHIETETVFHEGGPVAAKPYLRGFAAALAENPFAGRYVASISDMMDALTPLGMMLSKRLLDALGVGPSEIDAYGKGAIVGAGGETEHAALWHVPGGYAMRELLGDAKAIVPSSKKLNTPTRFRSGPRRRRPRTDSASSSQRRSSCCSCSSAAPRSRPCTQRTAAPNPKPMD